MTLDCRGHLSWLVLTEMGREHDPLGHSLFLFIEVRQVGIEPSCGYCVHETKPGGILMHSSRMRTTRSCSRLLGGGSALVHDGIHPPPPGPGPLWAWTPPM